MTITRERKSDYSGWETHWRGDPCARQFPGHRVRYFHRKHAGCGRIISKAGAIAPAQRVKKAVIPISSSHWRGNLPDDRNIFDSENPVFPIEPGDRQEVNCPKGKRDHPGVHQSADWFAMTGSFLTVSAGAIAPAFAVISWEGVN